MKRHYFIAVSLPNQVKQYLKDITQQVAVLYPFEKWVHEEDYHITLAFLGPSDQQKWIDCMEDIEREIQATPAFSMQISHFGIFGKEEKPRIFWCGLQEDKRLVSLQEKVTQICKKHHYRIDEKPFRPHITVARKYKHDVLFRKDNLTTCDAFLKEEQVFMVNTITLYESRVEKTPKYTALRSIYLKE
ncbi:MAG: RNA 2',3'-cyclic phosphodiesterase [Bacillus sp. (in: firmicutes)]